MPLVHAMQNGREKKINVLRNISFFKLEEISEKNRTVSKNWGNSEVISEVILKQQQRLRVLTFSRTDWVQTRLFSCFKYANLKRRKEFEVNTAY